MSAQKTHISLIGFPEDVEQVAGDGDGTDKGVDTDIGEHARHEPFRDSEPVRAMHDPKPGQQHGAVTDTGEQPDHTIQSDPEARTGDTNGGIEQIGQPLQSLQFPFCITTVLQGSVLPFLSDAGAMA